MIQETSDSGLIEIMSSEGVIPFKYYDSVGVLTEGIGMTQGNDSVDLTKIPFGVEQPLANVFEEFRVSIKKYEVRVAKAMGPVTTQTQFDAGSSFDFNTGGITRATWVKSHVAKMYVQAALQIMNWVTPPEITARRKREATLYEKGIYSNDGFVTIYGVNSNNRPVYSTGKRIDARPIIKGLRGANVSDSKAVAAKNQVAGTAGGAVATTGTSQIAIPDSPDSSSIKVFLLIAGGVFVIVAIAAALRWLRHKGDIKTQIAQIADYAKNAIHVPGEIVAVLNGAKGTDPEHDT